MDGGVSICHSFLLCLLGVFSELHYRSNSILFIAAIDSANYFRVNEKISAINSWRRHLFCNRGCFTIIVFVSHRGLIFQGVDLWHSLRNLVIYNYSLLVFFYFRSYVSVTEVRICVAAVAVAIAIAIAIAIASLIIGAHWVFDTYQKMVLREISYFAEMSYEYVKK